MDHGQMPMKRYVDDFCRIFPLNTFNLSRKQSTSSSMDYSHSRHGRSDSSSYHEDVQTMKRFRDPDHSRYYGEATSSSSRAYDRNDHYNYGIDDRREPEFSTRQENLYHQRHPDDIPTYHHRYDYRQVDERDGYYSRSPPPAPPPAPPIYSNHVPHDDSWRRNSLPKRESQGRKFDDVKRNNRAHAVPPPQESFNKGISNNVRIDSALQVERSRKVSRFDAPRTASGLDSPTRELGSPESGEITSPCEMISNIDGISSSNIDVLKTSELIAEVERPKEVKITDAAVQKLVDFHLQILDYQLAVAMAQFGLIPKTADVKVDVISAETNESSVGLHLQRPPAQSERTPAVVTPSTAKVTNEGVSSVTESHDKLKTPHVDRSQQRISRFSQPAPPRPPTLSTPSLPGPHQGQLPRYR